MGVFSRIGFVRAEKNTLGIYVGARTLTGGMKDQLCTPLVGSIQNGTVLSRVNNFCCSHVGESQKCKPEVFIPGLLSWVNLFCKLSLI